MERSIQQNAVLSLLDVAGIAAMAGAVRINREYQRVDMARNDAVKTFLKNTKDDGDVLIMLDCDHLYPRDIIPKLAKSCDYLHEVVGALAFRRSLPYDPVFYDLNDEGKATIPTSFTGGMVRCDIVGTEASQFEEACSQSWIRPASPGHTSALAIATASRMKFSELRIGTSA